MYIYISCPRSVIIKELFTINIHTWVPRTQTIKTFISGLPLD